MAEKFLEGKVLEGKLIQRKLSSGKLSAGKTFIRGKLPPEFPVAHKNYPGQRWGIRPGKERPWMVVYFWIMTILKILEIHPFLRKT